MSEISIVPTSALLIESFEAAVDAVAQERRYLASVKGPGVEAARSFVGSIMAGRGVQMVAITSEKRVIGWCDVVRKQREMFSHVGVLGLGVLSPYRGQGLGGRLARETIARAFQEGMEKVELAVFASNDVAIHLYRKLGFAVEGVRVRARKLDGQYDDELVMALFPERLDRSL